MTYKEAREYIKEASRYGSVLGLTSIRELMRRLDNPQDKMKIIHVAGTNGKGSTTAFLVSILACAGYRVGRYVSPAVFSYRERIQITDKTTRYISREGICEAIETIAPICEAMVKDGFSHPTVFEIETAMAYLYLYREQVDYAVIEVGMGGRLDATNVMKQPVLSVITSISLDHMEYLGDTIPKITEEKAGIVKENTPVITSNTRPEVIEILERVAKDKNTTLTIADGRRAVLHQATPEGTEFTYENKRYHIRLLGEHQIMNAVLAMEASKLLQGQGVKITEEHIRMGLMKAIWGGRFEIVGRKPYFILDGAHNEEAAVRLKEALERFFPDRKKIFILGVLADKDYHSILRLMAPLANIILTIASDNNRALASAALATEAKKYTNNMVIDAGTAKQAVSLAYSYAEEEDVILAFGSLSFLGDIRAVIFPHSFPED